MAYAVKILADSLSPAGKRLTTWQLTYPRFVHAELMTHRVFARNSASSRAIPVAKLMEQVRNDPAMPVWWGKNQPGMQAKEELSPYEREGVEREWLFARDRAVESVESMAMLGLHKQIANRLLEPWMFITVICSATEWDGWYRLRAPGEGPMDPNFPAQPEIQQLAVMMRDEYRTSVPHEMEAGAWHIPLVPEEDWIDLQQLYCNVGDCFSAMKKVSVARCARVSYLTHDGRWDYSEDIALHDRLAASGHWSPFEHVARAMPDKTWSGPFCGWRQYREDMDPNFVRVGR